jgi:membrane fusion protein, multidrug efflux system
MRKIIFPWRILAAILGVVLWCNGMVAQAQSVHDHGATHYSVNVGKVKVTNFPKYISALGSLSSVQAVTISPVVDGKISKIFYSNGQEVAKDAVMVQLDSLQEQAKVDKAQATYQSELQKYERYKQLESQNIADISKQELDDQKANLATAKAELNEQQASLDEMSIEAPFAGTLGKFEFKAGDYVTAGDTVVKLVNTKQLLVNYNIPQNYLKDLKKGQTVNIKVKAYPDKVFYGTVNFVSPTIDESSRSLAVQALVGNPDGVLLPGMFVRVKQQIAEQKDVLTVPDQSVMADIKGYYVFTVDNGKASQAYITLGTREKGMAQVLSGLKEGDAIVTVGQEKLQDGSLISVLPNGAVTDDSSSAAASTKSTQ